MILPKELFEQIASVCPEEALEFACIVSTPQHKNGQVFEYVVQRGVINKSTWYFKSIEHISGKVGKHDCRFHTEECFLQHRVI